MESHIGTVHDSCWAFVRHFYRAEMGIELPESPWQMAGRMRPVGEPQQGDIVLFEDLTGAMTHAGIVVTGGVLHHTTSHGVVYQVGPSAGRHRGYRGTYYRCPHR